ncbi:polysaccharide deacetylase family protein [Blastopirellula sp. JC732]|uniref:Polysaccharide deacetylase family protein n=1 Tax=Blastopirellula sediminis TaxID=2894196 RepID=A0A9X1MTH0_9BACT|nr:polysaccharide deacetylase family protein [Blastopirellula sediminis]MCC9605406.1 polysaccharide deacetylase family protein [Blastopirellula sediminis]MCC9631294.1 polysaccharide deacetylase family protein [Blastopirellula sediminis]
MSILRERLIDVYYGATLPWRLRWNHRRARVGLSPVMILFYHRVADDNPSSWTISNRQFEKHLDWIGAHFEFVSLEEAQRRIALRYNPRPAVAITFDDGYAENCEQAIPLLVKRKIPFTYFVSTGNILTGKPFPHEADAAFQAPVNTIEQLRNISAAGGEIGAHTRFHADLGAVDNEDELYDEVVLATRDLAAEVGQSIRYFAFPYGLPKNLNDRAFEMCREEGLLGVCSAYGGYNMPGEDPFHLQRIHGDPELSRLRNWLTIDPRKLSVPRYTPEAMRAVATPESCEQEAVGVMV